MIFIPAALGSAVAGAVAQDNIEGSASLTEPKAWERPVTIAFERSEGAINFHPLFNASLPLFRANVGGEEVCATVDTGASHTVISIELAARLRLDKLLFLNGVETPSVDISGYLTSPVEVEVPSQFRYTGSLIATPWPELICEPGLKLELILGMTAFKSMTVFVDHPKKRIAFLPSGRLKPIEKPHIKIPWIDNRIAGMLEGQTVSMMLDTGVNEPMLVKDGAWDTYFAGKAVVAAEPIRTAGGVITETVKIEDANLAIERATITARALRYPDTDWATPVVLGYAFFTQYPFIFDATGQAIYMLPNDTDK
ncbi:retropepsin-like aspartic protease [Erythrobacter donghaensis]|uniref:retropepsin-like aspartic protease n=1 Tax=Erythrobacter donghaensis TaxID=267135 RepID=UPI001302A6D7|nr:retropepsin-like aspartic protease [Erythrobacter donghaensis]